MTSFFKRLFGSKGESQVDQSAQLSEPVLQTEPQSKEQFDRIYEVPAEEVDGVESWIRETNEPELLNIEAVRGEEVGDWQWQVTIWLMEYVREDPLESQLRVAIAAALRAVPGVIRAEEDDREVWVIDGEPSGEDLVRAIAPVLDEYADRARAFLRTLNDGS
jgi:hypothetical protein